MTTIEHKTSNLIGSPPQNRWARQIRADFLRLAGGDASLLPQVPSARFWIDSRGITNLVDLHEAAAAFRDSYVLASPFTAVFPRFGRSEAVMTLQALDQFMVLDLETDGIGKQAQILEIAVVDQDGMPRLTSLIRPPDMSRLESRATEKARDANRITANMVRDAPTLPDIWEQVVATVTEPSSGILMTFNSAFDLAILRNCAQRDGLLTPTLTGLCAMRLASSFYEREFFLSLEEAGVLAGLSREDGDIAHRACDDARYTARLVRQLKSLSKGGSSQ